MNQSNVSRSPLLIPWLALGLASVGFAALQLALLPRGVIVYNDDFGYLRSILETAARNRPWTDDWLEPWAASLSILSAGVWRLTGSFRAAVHGVQALVLSLGFLAASATFVKRGFSSLAAILVSILLFTMPTILWKNLEFTGFFLNVSCLFGAVFFIERRRWGWFAAAACVALANRQSAAMWLVLSGWVLVETLWQRTARRNLRSIAEPAAAILAGCGCYALCSMTMNRTHAQEVMTAANMGSIQASTMMQGIMAAGIVAFAAVGLGNLGAWLVGNRRSHWKSGWRFLWIFAALLATYGLYHYGRSLEVSFEHGLYLSPIGQRYGKILFALVAAGWAVVRPKLNRTLLAGSLGCGLILCLRNPVWEYYLVDTALLAFLASFQWQPQEWALEPNNRGTARLKPVASLLCAAVLLWFHAEFARECKHGIDTHHAVVALSEKALRANLIAPDEISFAPFGFVGWHLYPYFIRHEGAGNVYIADFIGYLKSERLTMQIRDALDPRPLDNPDRVAAQGVFPIGWAGRHQFILRRQEGKPAPRPLDLSQYTFCPFPLNDAEWRHMFGTARSSMRAE